MFIEQGFKGLSEAWRYLVGFIAVFFAWQLLGAIPLIIAMFMKAAQGEQISADLSAMAHILGPNLFLFLMLLSFAAGLVGLFVVVRFLHKQSWRSLTTARMRVDWNRIGFAFLMWTVVSVIFIAIDIALRPDDYVFNFDLWPFVILVIIAVIFIPIQTSFEEYFMRGYLMQGLGIWTRNRWMPLLFTSAFFGLLHIFNPEVSKLGYGILIFYIGTGLFLGIITLMDEGLELALGFHAANNLTAAILVTADWTAFQTHSLFRDISDPELGWDVLLPVVVVYPLLLILFRYRYGWSNWKDKLAGKVVVPVASPKLTEHDDPNSTKTTP